MNHLPEIVEEEIAKVKAMVDDFGRPVDGEIVLLVAALRCHGFVTKLPTGGNVKRLQTPRIDIESPDASRLLKIVQEGPHSGPMFAQNNRALYEANQPENRRLFALLTEFYESHHLSYHTALTITLTGPGYGRLAPHASYFIGRSNQKAFSLWVEDAQAEMSAFAEFLSSKLL